MDALNIDAWHLFVQIAEHGSITRVANARDVAQSVISRQLAVIERTCGVRLFDRTGRGLKLSEAGHRIYPRVVHWLQEGAQLTRDVKFAASVVSGTVRIGVLASISPEFASQLFERVRLELPEVKLRILDGASRQISEWLDSDMVDVGIVVRNLHQERREDIPLATLTSCLIGAPDDRLTRESTVQFKQLDGIPLVLAGGLLAGGSNISRDLFEHTARRKGIKISVAVESDSIQIQKYLVAHSGVYAILGEHAVQDELASGALQASKIVSPELTRFIVFSKPPTRPASPACQAVLHIAQSIARPMFDRGDT